MKWQLSGKRYQRLHQELLAGAASWRRGARLRISPPGPGRPCSPLLWSRRSRTAGEWPVPASSRSTARRPAVCRKAGTTSSSGRSTRPGPSPSTSCPARSGCGESPVAADLHGFHIWALVLPQVVEGVLVVLVLYRAVRRLAGPASGLTAAAILAVTPVTVLLSRGNVADSLLILLLVLAADATSAALRHRVAAASYCCACCLGRPGVPGEDDPGLAGPARAGRRLPACGARGAAAHPVRACRAGRAGHRRGLAVLDDRRLAGRRPRA